MVGLICLTCPSVRRALCERPCALALQESDLLAERAQKAAVEVLDYRPPVKARKVIVPYAPLSRHHYFRKTTDDLR